jgi:hypothetical protein
MHATRIAETKAAGTLKREKFISPKQQNNGFFSR